MTKKQYDMMKQKYPAYVVLIRGGKAADYYKTFDEDARCLAEICGLPLVYDGSVLTAFFKHHELYIQLPKLIHAGKRVVTCD